MTQRETSSPPTIQRFLEEPTRRLEDWRELWSADLEFPVRSHRGLVGRLLVWCKKLLRPVVRFAAADLWDRQRVFNLILLEHLARLVSEGEPYAYHERRLDAHEERLRNVETYRDESLNVLLRHNDALFARVDQKLDKYRREAQRLWGDMGAALARLEDGDPTPLIQARRDHAYQELEHRHRGTQEEIAGRIEAYLPLLRGRTKVLDLGCGRGEALETLRDRGIPAQGVDSSRRMVELCREKGLDAEEDDLFAYLEGQTEASADAVVAFHVVEHLPSDAVDRLIRLAWRVLGPGGILIFETPSPLSLVMAARNFWIDPTHQRPVHPETLKLLFTGAGFEQVERVDLHPFAADERLPEIEVGALPESQHAFAYQVNRLCDELDDLLFGFQDYAMVGAKPSE